MKHQAAERRWANRNGKSFTIFCSNSTDPFLPQEFQFGITRSVLEAMIASPPDLLILQTHTHLVTKHMDIYGQLASRCRLRFHISIKTDRDSMPGLAPHASPVERRLEACGQLRQAGHFKVVTVSPLLPIDDADRFFGQIAVVDHFIEGDGTPDGRRTKQTALPQSMTLVDAASVRLEYRHRMIEFARRHMPGRVGISADGFAGIYA